MSPADDLCREVEIGEDSIEQEGVAAGRSVGTGEGRRASGQGWGRADASQLPASQAFVEALPCGGSGELEARQCGAKVQPGSARPTTQENSGKGGAKVQRIRANASGRASGDGRQATSSSRNVTALDAGGGPVEENAQGATASQAARSQASLRRVGATGRQLSRLVSGPCRPSLLDEYGGRCDLYGGSLAGR